MFGGWAILRTYEREKNPSATWQEHFFRTEKENMDSQISLQDFMVGQDIARPKPFRSDDTVPIKSAEI